MASSQTTNLATAGFRLLATVLMLVFACSLAGTAQMLPPPSGALDPARSAQLRLPPQSHLAEQFIWTAGDAAARDPALQAKVRGQDDKIGPHYFRARFHIAALPPVATLYIAGPRAATVYINGLQVLHAVDDGTRPKNLSVMTADVSRALRPGENVMAVEEVRGHSSLHTGASPTINQVTYGEVLVAKIIPRRPAVDAPPLVISDTHWRSTLQPDPGWQQSAFDDSAWPHVESIGVIGSKRDFLQWNADAGLYAWPGYSGISNDLRVFSLKPARVTRNATNTTFDFGREIAARLRLTSHSNTSVQIMAGYGESPEEAAKDKGYLGMRAVTVPPHATVFGPKSAFRYVKLIGMPRSLRVDAEVITYPVRYLGSFQSSDAMLNRIWETAAYTARLCMQEGIWDGAKRDRGRWMGDLDVTGRTITAVFGERDLMERTMTEIIGEPPVNREVNTIAGYSALWITGQASFYRHTGDLNYLRSVRTQLLDLLHVMDNDLENFQFTNPVHHKIFVDWSEGFNADTPEARAATHMEFAWAYKEAAFLLRELGDNNLSSRYLEASLSLGLAAQAHMLDQGTHTFGSRRQTNAMAVVSGVADQPQQREAIWRNVLSQVNSTATGNNLVVTPYYGYYVLSAMAQLGHRQEALDWMRSYWGGMLAEGATSFWEAYDPHWPKQDFHAFLEADNKRGYYISLAHGWSSGPAAWLAEQVLGVQPTGAGFSTVTIRPDLAGLAWARGSVPTPRGAIQVEVRPRSLRVAVPPGTIALVQLPFPTDMKSVHLNDRPLLQSAQGPAGRLEVRLDLAGSYLFEDLSNAH